MQAGVAAFGSGIAVFMFHMIQKRFVNDV